MRDFLDDRPIKLRRDRTNSPASGRPFVLAAGLIVLVVVLIVLDRQGVLGPTRGVAQQLLAPVAQRLTSARDAVADFATAPRTEDALRARLAELEVKNAELQAEVLRREQAAIENESLREQLAIEQATPWKLLGAEVTVRAPDAGRRVITIARGSAEGVAVGMAVLGKEPGGPAALIGIVEATGRHSSDILLVTDIGSQISARALHDGRASLGLVAGQWQRGSRLRLEQIDRAIPLAPGDPVVTAGLTSQLAAPLDLAAVPANVPIGTVERVEAAGQHLVAALRPFVDPDQVRYVWVILNQDD